MSGREASSGQVGELQALDVNRYFPADKDTIILSFRCLYNNTNIVIYILFDFGQWVFQNSFSLAL